MDYGANEYEKQKATAKLHDMLTTPVTTHATADGNTHMITGAHILSTQVRQTVTRILKAVNPEAYAQYRAMKYKDGEPDLATRKAAYEFAFAKFLDATYNVPGF